MLLLLLYSSRNQQGDSALAVTAGNSFSLTLTVLMLLSLCLLLLNAIFFDESEASTNKTLQTLVPPITFAASFNNVTEVLRLLNAGADIDERDWLGQTALHMAAKFGHPEVCAVLLLHGADPEAKNAAFSETPFHYSGRLGNKETFKMLLFSGADVNAVAKQGAPLDYCAEMSNSVEAVKMLIDNGANTSTANSNKQTPLHLAVVNNNFKMASSILQRGGNVNVKDVNGDTPLNWLAQQETPQIPLIALLLNKSADVNSENAKGKTPIQNAADLNNFPVILYLLEHGGIWNVTTQRPKDDQFPFVSPLAFATAYGEAHVVETLLQKYGPTGMVDERDWLKQTALHTAAIFGRYQAAKVLLKWKPDINALDGKGLSPLHHAAKCGDHDLLQLLIDAKANTTLNHPDYGTPLLTAVRFANAFLRAIKVLLKADDKLINTPDALGYTPLHWASTNENLNVMLLLLQNGANIEAKSTHGESPLNLLMGSSCCYPQLPTVQFLLDHGADINSRDASGCTPLCRAKKAEKRKEVLQFLIDHGATF